MIATQLKIPKEKINEITQQTNNYDTDDETDELTALHHSSLQTVQSHNSRYRDYEEMMEEGHDRDAPKRNISPAWKESTSSPTPKKVATSTQLTGDLTVMQRGNHNPPAQYNRKERKRSRDKNGSS